MTSVELVIPVAQLRTARALAGQLGHDWAQRWPDDVPDEGWTVNAIDERTLVDNGWPGITSPAINEDGQIVHTSGTGRISYIVGWSGGWRVRINRPDGVALEAVGNNVLYDAPLVIEAGNQPCYVRHESTLRRLLLGSGLVSETDYDAALKAAGIEVLETNEDKLHRIADALVAPLELPVRLSWSIPCDGASPYAYVVFNPYADNAPQELSLNPDGSYVVLEDYKDDVGTIMTKARAALDLDGTRETEEALMRRLAEQAGVDLAAMSAQINADRALVPVDAIDWANGPYTASA